MNTQKKRMTRVLPAIVLGAAMCAAPIAATAAPPSDASAASATTVKGKRLVASSLTVNHRVDPLGIDSAVPLLGWVVDAGYNGATQTAYEITVSSTKSRSGDVWSSGKVASSQSHDIEYAGPALDSQTRYYWSVRVWDDAAGASSTWSDIGWFETAFLDASEFGGDWIGRIADRPDEETPEALLRKEFTAQKSEVVSARISIAGLGYHKVYLNGERVGDHELDPAYTPYDARALYVVHDVTDMIQRGGNAIGVSLGRGNYSGYGDVDISQAPWLAEPELKLQLDIEYANGRTTQILSDGTWTTSDGPTVTNSLKYGEDYDARLEQPGWSTPGFDDSAWDDAVLREGPTGVLAAQDMEPIRVVGTMPEPEITELSDGVYVYDFGAVRAGWATIDMKGSAGSSIEIRYGEKLNADGTVSTGTGFGGTPSLIQTSTYTLSGEGEESYTPSYTYNGYQFVQIEVTGDVDILGVEGKILRTDVDASSSFESSNELLNRYHQAMINSTLSNLHGIPTDTPMYEKRGWAADAHLIIDDTLMNIPSSQSFWENWVLDHRDNQADDGGISVIVPNQTPGESQGDPFIGRTDDIVWSASYVLSAYSLYEQRGATRILEENFDGMQKWMDKWVDMATATDYIVTARTWGDHEPAYGSGVSNQIVATAYLYETATKMAEIADVVGEDAYSAQITEFAGHVRDAINDEFFDEETATYDWPYSASGGFGPAPSADEIAEINANQFQTDNVLPLALGIVPDGYRDALCENLIDDIVDRHDNHVTTGATVLKDVLPVVTECGAGDTAFAMATNPTQPGWGFFFLDPQFNEDIGTTVDTFFEAWYPTTRSHNHAFRGTIDDWLLQDVAGITSTSPGYATIEIAPTPVGDVDSASATIESPLGDVTSDWSVVDGDMTLSVRVPVGATATVKVPLSDGQSASSSNGASATVADGFAIFEVGSGSYTFTSH